MDRRNFLKSAAVGLACAAAPALADAGPGKLSETHVVGYIDELAFYQEARYSTHFLLYVNGVPQIEGVDFVTVGERVVFYAPLPGSVVTSALP